MIELLILTLVVYAIGTTYVIRKLNDELNLADNELQALLKRVYYALRAMRDLDDRQMFEEDDEVGEVFRRLSDIVYEMLDVSGETAKLVENRPRPFIEAE